MTRLTLILTSAALLTSLCFVLVSPSTSGVARAQATPEAVVVSAASFTAPVAADSIAAAFGAQLSTGTETATDMDPAQPGIQLPTTLAGTTITVNGRPAPLFFVSPGQVNFLIPPQTELGAASVAIRNSLGIESRATVEIVRISPQLFTLSSEGIIPAALLVRVRPDGTQTFEDPYARDPVSGRPLVLRVDFGAGDRLFLALLLSGIRQAPDPNGDGNVNETVSVPVGGLQLQPSFVGPQGEFVGLDQLNVELPSTLVNRGRVNLAVTAEGFDNPRLFEIEVADARGPSPPAITGVDPPSALASQPVIISGGPFSPNAAENVVRVGGREARLTSSSDSQLTALIPFGAATGRVTVRTPFGTGESALDQAIQTSISGTIETTDRQPIPQTRITLRGSGASVLCNSDGSFVLPANPTPLAFLEINAPSVTPPFPQLFVKLPVLAGRDNTLEWVAMQQASGAGLPVGGGGAAAAAGALSAPAQEIESDQVRFALTPGIAQFPDGSAGGLIFLSVLRNGRTPRPLPPGVFSTTVAQLTPLRVKLSPGGKLVFPNRDNLSPNARAPLYKLDQDPASPTLGEFIIAGTATVSPDAQRVETDDGAITETSIYFVGARPPSTIVVGRVVESADGAPIRDAVVRVNSRETRTDGNGGFILTNIALREIGQSSLAARNRTANTRSTSQNFLPLTIEVFVHRASRRVDRVTASGIVPFAGGITSIGGPLTVPSEAPPRPPALLITSQLAAVERIAQEINFVADDLDSDIPPQVTVSGADFASISSAGDINYTLRLAPPAGSAGRRTLTVTARAISGLTTTQQIDLLIDPANRPPALSAPASASIQEGKTLSFTLEATDPDGDPLTFTATQLPPGASFFPESRMFQWMPGFAQSGSYQATFTVSDSGSPPLVDTKVVAITVEDVNRAPLLAVNAEFSVAENTPLSFRALATDPDGDRVTCSSPNLPLGASLDQVSCIFSWTPDFIQANTYRVEIVATDNGSPPLSTKRTVTINVLDTNRPPVLALPPSPAFILGKQSSFIISGSDPDGDPISFSATSLPPGATFDPMTRTFSWQPGFDAAKQEAVFNVTFSVTETAPSGLSASSQLPVRVIIGEWISSGNLSLGRYLHSANLLNDGRVLAAGGAGDEVSLTHASAEIFSPPTFASPGSWTPTGSLNETRRSHTGTLLGDGRVLVAGGSFLSSGVRIARASAEIFDPGMGIWSFAASMSAAREMHTATRIGDGRVLVAGGVNASVSSASIGSAEIYSPMSNSWASTGSLNTPRAGHTATLLSNGQVLIAGGTSGSGSLQSAELYNPAGGTFSPTGSMQTARSNHTATLLPDGRVLVAGGVDASGMALKNAEIYDPEGGQWSGTGDMNVARTRHDATLARNGRVLVSGGQPNGAALADSEWYDPASGVWLATDQMTDARADHRLTLLSNGWVLASGGVNVSGISAAEVFNVESVYADIVRISNLRVNGGAFYETVAPGSVISVDFDFSIQNLVCPGCIDQIIIGFHNGPPLACVYNGIPGPVGDSGSASFNLSAPLTPGTYFITFDRSEQFSCANALGVGNWATFLFPAPVTNYIGVLIVQ